MSPRLEEITYDMSRAALADQESLVSGIRSRTGTLVAAQALVASFLGDAATDGGALDAWGWAAVGTLAFGLLLAAVIVAPWRMRFTLDTLRVYDGLRRSAAAETEAGTLGWLVKAGRLHHEQHVRNGVAVRRLVGAFAALSVVTIVQTLLWIVAIGVR